MSTDITIAGNLAADPELKFTQSGKALCRFTVMTSRSRKNEAGTWESTDVTGWAVTAWEYLAEHCAESLQKGDPVVVIGQAASREWEQDGQKRSRIEVTARIVAVDLRRGVARRERVERGSTGGSAAQSAPQSAPAADPWASHSEDIPF